MPVSFKDKFSPAWQGFPPHMSKEDYAIFLRGKHIIFENAIEVYYDAGLGGSNDLADEMEESYKRMWTAVTQKRIDVLVRYPTLWGIVEIRPRATSTAAGRLLQYQELWLKDPPDNTPVKLILMTDFPDPDLRPLLQKLDIELIVV